MKERSRSRLALLLWYSQQPSCHCHFFGLWHINVQVGGFTPVGELFKTSAVTRVITTKQGYTNRVIKEVRGHSPEVSQWKLKTYLVKHHLLWLAVNKVSKKSISQQIRPYQLKVHKKAEKQNVQMTLQFQDEIKAYSIKWKVHRQHLYLVLTDP